MAEFQKTKFQARELAAPKKSKAPLPEPHLHGKWVKPLESTPKLPGAQKWCVSVEGMTGKELEAKIMEVENAGGEFLIMAHRKGEIGPDGNPGKDKNGYIIRPSLVHPITLDRQGISSDGKPFAVAVVELPTFERKRLAEREAAELEKAKALLAAAEAKAKGQTQEVEADGPDMEPG